MHDGQAISDRLAGIDVERMREYRLGRTREYMKKYNIGTLVTFDAWDIRYITGAYVTIPGRWSEAQSVVLPVEGNPLAFVSSCFIQEKLNEEMPWLNGMIVPRLGNQKLSFTVDSLMPYVNFVADYIYANGLQDELVGLDGCSSEFLYAEAFARRGLKCVDAKECMFMARRIKNADEIACIRMASTIAEAAFEDIRTAIRPGIKECEIVGIGMNKLYALGCDETQEFVVASGPRTNPLHIDFTDRMVRPGDLIAVDINGASYLGYKTCYYRTFCCGKATQAQKDAHKEALDMMYNAMSYIKAGNTTKDVVQGFPKSPEYWGFKEWKQTTGLALCHGLGLSLHDFPMFRPQSELNEPTAVLEVGDVLAVETWAGPKGGDFGVRLEEVVAVTETGYELLTRYPVQELIECNV